MSKTATAFRLSDDAHQIVEALASQLGVSKTAVIEIALREKAEGANANALAIYQGEGEAALTHERTVSVRFSIVQNPDGDLDGRCTVLGAQHTRGQIHSLTGTTAEGWNIVVDCHPAGGDVFEMFSWNGRAFSPRKVVVTNPNAQADLVTVDAALLNFAFPDNTQHHPLHLTFRGIAVMIGAVPAYKAQIEHLEQFNGKRHTATLTMKADGTRPVEEIRDEIAGILHPLSLAGGRLLGMPFVALSDTEGHMVAKWHGDVISHPYRTQANGLGLTSNPVKLVVAWGNETGIFDTAYLNRRVHQYMDCVLSDPFLDSRAILAVSMLDSLVTDYSWKRHPGTGREDAEKRSFKELLMYMVDDLKITLEDEDAEDFCDAIVNTRNKLIHDGRFNALSNNRKKLHETLRAQWLAFAFLTRLVVPDIGIRPMYDPLSRETQWNEWSDLDL